MPTRPFTLALIQMLVEGGRPQANLARARDRIAQAARAGAELAVLPEALDLGWTHDTSLAERIPNGNPCRQLREAARQHRLHVCAGLVERSGDRCYNAALLIGPEGDILLHHRKLNDR